MKVKWHGAEYKMINATENDLQRIIDWKLDTIIGGYPGEDIPPNEKQKMINYVNNEAQMYLKNTRMILVDDQIVGMLIAYDKDGDWFIDDIYIIPEFRSHGIGFHVLCDECREHETLSLYVYKTNTKAIRLYNRCGFSVTEVTGDRYFMRRDPDVDGESISYAMGVDNIDEVRLHMDVEDTDDGDYEVIFPSNRAWQWELFISEQLQDTYWNEYIDLKTHKIHFMFNENGIIDHVINNGFDENPELLNRCNRLCEQDFKTMKDLIYSNTFYRTTLEQVWGDKMSEPVTEAFFKEAYLKAKEKEKLKDSAYGIPELRKFPLTNKNGEYDENHIRMAVKFFGSAPKKYKKELAKRILRAAHSIDLDTKDWNTINNALKNKESHVNEAAVSRGAYTSKGINWANVQPVTMVYKRFSTKNREQMEPIKRFWEISDKYFPEPSMTSGFGWDWTGWETDFAYGIIINDKKVPPEFMEELKQEFPDIILDENFLIPINYEEVYECSFEEMDATYDKIWSKGFLECEYEQYPALGRMKISVIYKKDADKLNSDIAKYIKTVPTVKGYRFTLQDKNVGIYEELKRIMYNETNSPDTWEEFKKSPACSWLPSPPSYGEDNKSYFTKLGYDKFMSDTWPVLTKYINDDTIDCEEVEIPVSEIVYQDDYQFITGSPLEESNTERKNLIMKEQVTKILEAYNSGVLTQEEAVEKIVQEGPHPNVFTAGNPDNKDLIKYFAQNKNGEITYADMLEKVLQGVRSQDWEGPERVKILKRMSNNWDERYYRHIKDAYEKMVEDRYNRKMKAPEDYDTYNNAVSKISRWVSELEHLRPDAMRSKKEQKEHDDSMERNFPNPERRKEAEDFSRSQKMSYANRLNEGAIMNELKEKQEKIMESFKMGIINATEGMRLIERVMMEADYITEEEDTAYEGDDNNEPEDITPADTDDDTSDSEDSNIESLADYINSLDASERADLLAKINTDVATAGDADSSDDIENTDDTAADDLTPPDGETEEPTADGDTDAEPEVETESAKAIKEPDERLINAYKNVSLDDMEV